MNIPLSVLVEACEALRVAKDLPTPYPNDLKDWTRIMRAHSKLEAHLTVMTRPVPVEVTE